MRRLFMAIFIPVLFILGTPALVATLMYDGTGDTHMPTHLYVEGASAKDMLYEELTMSIDDVESGATDDMIFNLSQDIINTAIFEAIRQPDVNPDYMPNDDCVEDSCNYIFAEPIQVEGFDISLRVVGVWVEFAQDKFILNVFLEVDINEGITYKTIMETHFILQDEANEYVLKFDKIQIGNLPIPGSLISSIISTLDKQIDQVDFDDMSDDVPVGELDVANLTYKLQKDEILEQMASEEGVEPDAQAQLAQEVLSIIFDNNLLSFELVDEEFVLTAGVSLFKNDDSQTIPDYLYDMHFKEEVEGVEVIGEFDVDSFNPETYLKDKFTEYIFNYALVGGNFVITEQTFNKLIYFGASGFEDTRTTYEYENLTTGEIEVLDIGLKAIWFDLAPEEIYINALFKIAGIDSLLQIRAVDVSDPLDDSQLMFEFAEITFGKDLGEADGDYLSILDLEAFKQVFAELGDVEFGEFDADGTLIISVEGLSSVMNDGSADDDGTVSVDGILLVEDGIELVITVNSVYADVIEDFTTALQEVVGSPELIDDLESILDTTTEGPEQDVYESVVELQDLLNDDDPATNPDAEQITEMFESFEELDPETQVAFLETFEALIPEGIFDDYEDLFND
ncbi:MAG: hypothetical protein KQ78_00049 [Candidatus Izimaplasma bacterium HR2]|nr:MAG: hypothetical protein KQ78_00049 [Candidatus Izimaplasma bacterium HR2]